MRMPLVTAVAVTAADGFGCPCAFYISIPERASSTAQVSSDELAPSRAHDLAE